MRFECIGGVLRDHAGKILCVFSSHLGFQDVILAELLAILRALVLFGSNPELIYRPLTVISDSKIAVRWIMNGSPDFNSHEQIVGEIRKWLNSFDQATVEFHLRSSNSFADTLAKKGLKAGVNDLWWSVF